MPCSKVHGVTLRIADRQTLRSVKSYTSTCHAHFFFFFFFFCRHRCFLSVVFAASPKMPPCVPGSQRLQKCTTIYHNLQMYILTLCVGQLLQPHIVAAAQICFFEYENNARACGLF